VAFTEWVRPHLMTPLTARTPFNITSPRQVQVGAHLPHGSWIVSESIVNRAGRAVDGDVINLFGNGSVVSASGVHIPGLGSCPNLAPSATQPGSPNPFGGLVAHCINELHLTNVVVYQPANRYWPFQVYESLIFLGLAVAVGAFTVWWVRRLD
jgi:hypothetical protein